MGPHVFISPRCKIHLLRVCIKGFIKCEPVLGPLLAIFSLGPGIFYRYCSRLIKSMDRLFSLSDS